MLTQEQYNQNNLGQPSKIITCTTNILIVALLLFLVYLFWKFLIPMGQDFINQTKESQKDARIKVVINQAKVYIVAYFNDHNTYEGLTLPSEFTKEIKSQNGQVVSRGTSDSFVVFVQLPGNKKFYCIDKQGSNLELNQAPVGLQCK